METITITLNGTTVSAPYGTTILQLAKEVGIYIPTLCHDEHLKPYGACRLCIVEDKSSGRIFASCVTPIAKGMVIQTDSPRLISHRRNVVSLMLASHPESCIICEKGNRCELRKIAADLGIRLLNLDPMPQPVTIIDANPFMVRDLSKCILCAKCIRADHELVVEGAIDYIDRGFDARPATLGLTPLEKSNCTFCGTCLTMCPTGALYEKRKPYRGTSTSWTPSVCPYCGCGCPIGIGSFNNTIVEASPNFADSLNRAALCARGHFGIDYASSSQRLTSPMVRKNSHWEKVSWDEALEAAAQMILHAVKKNGPDAVGFVGSVRCTNEENYLLQKLARTVIGTNNIDTAARFWAAPFLTGMEKILGRAAMTHPLSNIEKADILLVIGASPSQSHPVASYYIKRAVQYALAELFVISAAPDRIDKFARMILRPKAGAEPAVLGALLYLLLHKEKSLRYKYKELWNSVKKFQSIKAEKQTGLAWKDLEAIAEKLAQAKRPAIICGEEVLQNNLATQCAKAISYIALLSGALNESGGGLFPLILESNTQGAWDMGASPERLPGAIAHDKLAISFIENQWHIELPSKKGLTITEMMQAAMEGKIKTLVLMGENLLLSFPSYDYVKKSLSSVENLILIDVFPTETMDFAHVVLPGAVFAEKEGTFTSMDRRIQKVNKASEPPADARPEWKIIIDLAARLDGAKQMSFASPEDIMTEISHLVKNYQSIDYKLLKKGGIPWPCSEELPKGSPILFKNAMAKTSAPDMKLNLDTPADNDDVKFPFHLGIASSLYNYGTGTRSSRSERLKKIDHTRIVMINPDDAAERELKEGDVAEVASPQGKIKAKVKIMDGINKKHLILQGNDKKDPTGKIIPLMIDEESKAPAYHGITRVDIRRAE